MGGKSGKANPSYNYFGNIAGGICRGPIDEISAIIIDGKTVWEGTDARPASYVAPPTALNSVYDDFSARLDAKWFVKGKAGREGHLRVYWGTDDQGADPALVDHPHYKGLAYVVCWKFLFGREKTPAPNIEVVCTRKPVADTALVAAVDNTLEDGQANPVAVMAELLTSPAGAGLAVSMLDGTSWQAAAAYCRTIPTLAYCSPLLVDAGDLRGACAGLLAMFDGALAWTAAGKLAVRLLKPGVDPGGLPVLDAPLFVELPKISSGSWGDIATQVVCRHVDRARKFKQTSTTAANLVAARLRSGEQSTRAIELAHVTRPEQANRWAVELVRRSQQPPVTVEVSCRPERVVGIAPGSKVLIDVDPEPGGAGMAQLAVVEERREKAKSTALRLICDPLTTATPYSPTFEQADPEAAPVEEIEHALLVPLGPAQGGPAVAVLATRPQADAIGYDVFFLWDTDADASLADEAPAELGRGVGFCCRLDLVSNIAEDAATADFHLTDASTAFDAYLSDLAPNSALGAGADELVIVVANVDGGTGRIVITDGVPEVEVLSVIGRTPAGPSDTHTYQILRARLAWPARAWTTSCQAWLLPAANLIGWAHPDMAELLRTGAVGTLRLAAVTASDEAETLTERTFAFPGSYDIAPRVTWVSPSGSQGVTDGSGNISLSITLFDWDGDLTAYRVHADLANGDRWEIVPWMPVGPTRQDAWNRTVNFPVGVHKVVATAKDKRGIETTSERSVVRVTGGTLVPPTFTPPGADNLRAGITNVTLTGASPATKLQYSVVPVGVAAPAGAGTEELALTKLLAVQVPKRVWARTGDGVGNWSTWVSADYTSATSGGGTGGGGGGGGRLIVKLN